MGGTFADRTWPTANRAFFYPFCVEKSFLATSMVYINTATPSAGNVDLGIYDRFRNRLASYGGAANGAAGVRVLALTSPVTLGRGYYFMAMVFTLITGSIKAQGPGAASLAANGVCHMDTAYPLPSTATFTRCGSDWFPYMSIL